MRELKCNCNYQHSFFCINFIKRQSINIMLIVGVFSTLIPLKRQDQYHAKFRRMKTMHEEFSKLKKYECVNTYIYTRFCKKKSLSYPFCASHCNSTYLRNIGCIYIYINIYISWLFFKHIKHQIYWYLTSYHRPFETRSHKVVNEIFFF